MAAVTIFAIISYIVMPEDAWLPRNRISHFIDSKGVTETIEEVDVGRRPLTSPSGDAQVDSGAGTGTGTGNEDVDVSGSSTADNAAGSGGESGGERRRKGAVVSDDK